MSEPDIVGYYDECEIDYRLVWDLDHSLAMHYGFWDRGVRSLREALRRENEVLARMVGITKADLVLDAGCGVGGSAIYLAKEHGCRVIGITLSQRQAASASAYASARGLSDLASFCQDDFTRTGVPDKVFDVVWAIESVCHAASKLAFAEEAYRVLKEGGRLIVADGFAADRELDRREQTVMQKWLMGWGVASLATTSQFSSDLNQVGFTDVGFTHATSMIMPSAKRLRRLSLPGFLATKVAQSIGLRSSIQTGNVVAAYYQYQAFARGLAVYGVWYGRK